MKWVDSIEEMAKLRCSWGESVGMVPTMGYLHEGHLSLVRRARGENDYVVVSVFVNPTQFGPREDFARYPRDLEQDKRLLEAEGVDLVFAPAAGEMYPPGHATHVVVEGLGERLEGAHRPGHFRGVATVVTKLLSIVRPQRAYFGQKDAQQLAVIRRLVTDLNLGPEVIACPTVREPDGLALSSRNFYLSTEERRAAPVLFRALEEARRLWMDGERRGARLREKMLAVLEAEPLAGVDYAVVCDPATFEELEEARGPALLAIAVRIGGTRLIDNLELG